MTEEAKWKTVNKCETLEALMLAIHQIADEDGEIKGSLKTFKADKQIILLSLAFKFIIPANGITRAYGIRQQMLYIMLYEGKLQTR